MNQLNGSRTYRKSNPYVLTGNGIDYSNKINDVTAYLKAGTYTLSAQTDGVWVDHKSTTNPNDKGVCLFLVGATNGYVVSSGKTLPKTITIFDDGQYNIRVNLYSDGTTNISRKFWDFKLDSGSTATPWMPSQQEATTADYPSYIGTYTGKIADGQSTDPVKYNWKKIE